MEEIFLIVLNYFPNHLNKVSHFFDFHRRVLPTDRFSGPGGVYMGKGSYGWRVLRRKATETTLFLFLKVLNKFLPECPTVFLCFLADRASTTNRLAYPLEEAMRKGF